MEADARGFTLKPGISHLLFEILGISLELPSVSNSRYENPNILKFLILEIPSIFIEIQGFRSKYYVFRKFGTIVFHR